MKIVNLLNFTEVTAGNIPDNEFKAMVVYEFDSAGFPAIFEIKQVTPELCVNLLGL
ncbi:hypothetical protein [Neptunicella sp. SCSIO 80796]|uniref:hypothetical protein n=1 Tax=Neptunicella plasticusilytica TaxID=3117012 RepID=UPI003A4DD131